MRRAPIARFPVVGRRRALRLRPPPLRRPDPTRSRGRVSTRGDARLAADGARQALLAPRPRPPRAGTGPKGRPFAPTSADRRSLLQRSPIVLRPDQIFHVLRRDAPRRVLAPLPADTDFHEIVRGDALDARLEKMIRGKRTSRRDRRIAQIPLRFFPPQRRYRPLAVVARQQFPPQNRQRTLLNIPHQSLAPFRDIVPRAFHQSSQERVALPQLNPARSLLPFALPLLDNRLGSRPPPPILASPYRGIELGARVSPRPFAIFQCLAARTRRLLRGTASVTSPLVQSSPSDAGREGKPGISRGKRIRSTSTECDELAFLSPSNKILFDLASGRSRLSGRPFVSPSIPPRRAPWWVEDYSRQACIPSPCFLLSRCRLHDVNNTLMRLSLQQLG